MIVIALSAIISDLGNSTFTMLADAARKRKVCVRLAWVGLISVRKKTRI